MFNFLKNKKKNDDIDSEIAELKAKLGDMGTKEYLDDYNMKGGYKKMPKKIEQEEDFDDEDDEEEEEPEEEEVEDEDEEEPEQKPNKFLAPKVKPKPLPSKPLPSKKRKLQVVNELPVNYVRSGTKENGEEVDFETINEALEKIREDLTELKERMANA